MIKYKINPKMLFIKSKANLSSDKRKAFSHFHQKILKMIDNAVFQITFRKFRFLFQPQKFQHIRVFNSIFRFLDNRAFFR